MPYRQKNIIRLRARDRAKGFRATKEATAEYRKNNPEKIKTNIVFFKITKPGLTPEVLAKQLAAEGVRMGPKPPDQMRAVTNYHITSDDIDHVLGVFKKVLGT